MELSSRVAEARELAGLTQEQVSAATGLGRTVIAKIEAGSRKLAAIELVVLQDSETGELTSLDLWIMTAVNWVIAVAAIFVMANVLGQRRLRPETPVPSPLANMTAEAD